MARDVRTGDPHHGGARTPDLAQDPISIDLRHGDLSDDEVVALLVRLARQQAGIPDDQGRHPGTTTAPDTTEPSPNAATGASGRRVPDALFTAGPPPRRRWTVPALIVLVVVLATTLGVFAARSRQDQVAAADQAGSAVIVTPPDELTTPPSTAPTPATVATTEAERTAAFCGAVGIYTLNDLTVLAENGVRDPAGTAGAYATMVANAPPVIADEVAALGPITGKVQSRIEDGSVTTPKQMQEYLAGGAPPEQVTQWIAAQQAIVAQLPALCPATRTP